MRGKKNSARAIGAEVTERLNKLEDEVNEIKKHLVLVSQIGVSIEEVKAKARKPVKRSPRVIKEALGIVGIFEGPDDLSENTRGYLHGEK